MARFYQTSSMNFVDWNKEPQGEAAASDAGVASAFGDIKSIPQDRQILAETLAGYEAEVNQLAQELQANPKALKTLEPRINQLRQRIAMDRQTGVLKAIQDRYDQDAATQKGILDNLKDDPTQAALATQEYQANIPALNFDPETRTYNQIAPYQVAKPFLQPQQQDWAKTYGDQIKETLLDEFTRAEKLDAYNNLYTRGELSGITGERALGILSQKVTPEMIAAANQQRRLYGLEGDDEANFIVNGQPNLNTQIGRLIASTAESVTNTTMDAFRTKTENVAAVEQAKFRVQNQDADWWASKLNTLYSAAGLDNPSSRNQEVVGEVRRLLQGQQTPDGFTVTNVEVDGSSGKPMVVLQRTGNEPKRSDFITTEEYDQAIARWRNSGEQKRVELNVTTLPSLGFSTQFTGKIGVAARSKGNFNPDSQEFGSRSTGTTERRTAARTDTSYRRRFGQSMVGDVFNQNGGGDITSTQVNELVRRSQEANAPMTEQEVRDEYNRLSGGAQRVERPAPPASRPARQPAQQPAQGQEEQPRRTPVRWNPPSQ